MSAQAEDTHRRWRARKTGGHRKPGAREANGRPQRPSSNETQAQVMATALAQPHRRGIRVSNGRHDGPRGPRDERAGYVFGRMRLGNELSKPQHDALAHWLTVFVRYARALGLPQARFGNCLAVDAGRGYDGEDQDPVASAQRARRAVAAYEALQNAIADGMPGEFREANQALVHVVLMDRDPILGMTGTLRAAANVIDRFRAAHGPGAVDN